MIEAMQHAKKYLSQHLETQSVEIHRAAGLLAFPKDTDAEPYKVGARANDFSENTY
jgi:macrophage erythroblast attacher